MREGRPRRWLRRGLGLLGALALALTSAEAGLWLLASRGHLAVPAPPRGASDFWDGDHPEFGVWHRPGARTRHEKSCFSVEYRANSIGARDVERAPDSDDFRVVVLGDSVVEGWGLRPEERFSNRLERATGLEHLNFGMSHFGPYQQLLVYRELASRYAHDAVIATLLPVNDFSNLDFEGSRHDEWYAYRYRPYLVRENGAFRHLDHREPPLRRLLRRHTWVYNAWRALPYLLANRTGGALGAARRARPRARSAFYEFADEQFEVLARVMELLGEAVGGKKLAVVLVPTLRDLGSFRDRGPDPLSARLAPVVEGAGGRLVNLLPLMHDHSTEWAAYYHSCDSHWSAHGNRVAARLLLDALGGGFYPPG